MVQDKPDKSVYVIKDTITMEQTNWEQVRIQAAIAAMPIIERMFDCYIPQRRETLAYHSVELADALIEELKKK